MERNSLRNKLIFYAMTTLNALNRCVTQTVAVIVMKFRLFSSITNTGTCTDCIFSLYPMTERVNFRMINRDWMIISVVWIWNRFSCFLFERTHVSNALNTIVWRMSCKKMGYQQINCYNRWNMLRTDYASNKNRMFQHQKPKMWLFNWIRKKLELTRVVAIILIFTEYRRIRFSTRFSLLVTIKWQYPAFGTTTQFKGITIQFDSFPFFPRVFVFDPTKNLKELR